MSELDFSSVRERLRSVDPVRRVGRVADVVGLVIESDGPALPVGGVCTIERGWGLPPIDAEVVGFRGARILLMSLGDTQGIEPGNRIVARSAAATVHVGPELLGRVLDGTGAPIDGSPMPTLSRKMALQGAPINPLSRPPIREPIDLGVRSINALLTCGRGQRLGIFAGSGVGKSTLLGMMARSTEADVNVIALIGERGREVREFIERDLGPEGLARSIVVVATSDQSPLLRIRGAWVATAIAEFFRGEGAQVLLMMDSLTRLAMAQREVGLSTGEPPSSRGYTPSVFALLPRLIERAGNADRGSVTGLYTVLVDGDDMNEPIADAARGLLDGHVVLTRRLAGEGHFPAVDVLESLSRLMGEMASEDQRRDAMKLRSWMASYQDAEDLIRIGAYREGADPMLDEAIRRRGAIREFLRQDVSERAGLDESVAALSALTQGAAP